MDFEKHIENKLLEMQNLEDRKVMRQILGEVLLPMYQYSEEKFNGLIGSMLEEVDCRKASYDIITGIVDHKKYDVTSTYMKLMNPSDIEEKQVDLTEVRNALMQGNSYSMFSVFIKADYLMLKRLLGSNRKFEGIIRTKEGEYKARFELRRKETYLRQLQQLYRVFLHNSIQWKTVCAPYLYKIFDVYLCESEPLEGVEIEEISIKFEEFEPFIHYDYVPIWNLEKVQVRSSALPVPCEDQIHYQHQIFKERLEDTNYLVMNTEIPILNQRKIKGDLHITCRDSGAIQWTLLKFNPDTNLRYEELLMHNQYSLPVGRSVRTKAAIEKFVQSLGYTKFLELKGVNTHSGTLNNRDTYSMDDFIEDEIKLKDNQNTLVFEFMKKELEHYLNHDILSYIISTLQREYPEYQCVGRFL